MISAPGPAFHSFLRSVVFLAVFFAASQTAFGVTVMEVARDLACPCECPLVLEDCNMSCGIKWKDDIGKLISEGNSKEEIIAIFVDKYGESAILTTMQRINGKIYQYTRGFDTQEWVMLFAGAGFWTVLLFGGIFLGTSRIVRRKKNRGVAS